MHDRKIDFLIGQTFLTVLNVKVLLRIGRFISGSVLVIISSLLFGSLQLKITLKVFDSSYV